MSTVEIRMLTSISGVGICLDEGAVEAFPIEDAARFVKSGQADPAGKADAEALEAYFGANAAAPHPVEEREQPEPEAEVEAEAPAPKPAAKSKKG